MNILLTGASGFLGQAIHTALTKQGHTVICCVRHPKDSRDIAVDFERDTHAVTWLTRLQGIDAVVNAVGLLGGSEAQMMAVHATTPTALAQAAAQCGVGHFVQLSALGVDSGLKTLYFRSKAAGELGVRSFMPQAQIVRPSLVFGHAGASSRLFMQLTRLPVVMLPDAGSMTVQPVHLKDLAAGVVALLSTEKAQTLDCVGPQPITMADYLKSLATQLGRTTPFKLQTVLPMPLLAVRYSAKLGQYLPQQVWTPDTLAMLCAGSVAEAAPFAAMLGRALITVERFVAHE